MGYQIQEQNAVIAHISQDKAQLKSKKAGVALKELTLSCNLSKSSNITMDPNKLINFRPE